MPVMSSYKTIEVEQVVVDTRAYCACANPRLTKTGPAMAGLAGVGATALTGTVLNNRKTSTLQSQMSNMLVKLLLHGLPNIVKRINVGVIYCLSCSLSCYIIKWDITLAMTKSSHIQLLGFLC